MEEREEGGRRRRRETAVFHGSELASDPSIKLGQRSLSDVTSVLL
jgi:hypothetical protein